MPLLSAQENPGKKAYDIPADDAERALKTFAHQSGLEVLFVTEATQGVRTLAVKGKYTPREALDQLLAGTPLTATQSDPTGAFKVRREKSVELAEKNVASRASRDRAADPGEKKEDVVKLDTFEVFGRKTLNMDIQRTRDDVQPYIVFPRDIIASSSASTVEEFLQQRLTAITTPSVSNQTGVSGPAFGVSRIDLRGLGADETLILIDGRRTSGYAAAGTIGQTDLNAIPISAIEKIEVLPTTASGVYGGSATGGVINVVMRRNYQGIGLSTKYDAPLSSGGAVRSYSFYAGNSFSGGRTMVTVAASYLNTGALFVGDRDFLVEGRTASAVINPNLIYSNSIPPLGRTTNIRSVNGANLVLKPQYGGVVLSAPFTSIPAGYMGIAQDGALPLAANVGSYNLELAATAQASGGAKYPLAFPSVRQALSGDIRHIVNKKLEAFATVSRSRNHAKFATNNVTQTFTVSQSAPNNPFAQDIRITTPTFGGDVEQVSTVTEVRGIVGLIASLPKEWHLEVDVALSRVSVEGVQASSSGILANGAQAVLLGSLDVLRDTNVNSIDFEPYRIPSTKLPQVRSQFLEFAVRTGGPTIKLPGGPIVISALVNRAETKLADQHQIVFTGTTPIGTSETIWPARHQFVNSAYVEARLPLIAPGGTQRLAKLEAQLAGRVDQYDTLGGSSVLVSNGTVIRTASTTKQKLVSANPSLGVRFTPTTGYALRASYSEGFHPPSLTDLTALPPSSRPVGTGLVDPRRGNEAVGAHQLIRGGNPELKPELSKSVGAGIVFTPGMLRNFRISVDWAHIRKHDNISSIGGSGQDALDAELFVPGLVKRGSTTPGDSFGVAPVTEIFVGRYNGLRAEVEVVDVTATYLCETARGKITLDAAITKQIRNTIQASLTSLEINQVGTIQSVKWNANAQLGWSFRRWQASWMTRYVDRGYFSLVRAVNQNTGAYRTKSYVVHDVSGSYHWTPTGIRFVRSVTAKLGISNLFNVRPYNTGGGTFADPRIDQRLRRWSCEIQAEF